MRLRRLAALAAPPAAVAAGIASGVVSLGPPAQKSNASPPMPQPVGCRRLEDGSVESFVNYQHASVRQLSTKIDAQGGSDGVLVGAKWSPERVLVRNGRASANAFSLERNGFAFVPTCSEAASSSHVDYYDESAVTQSYYASCEALVREATGAAICIAFDHNVRCDAGKAVGRRLRGGSTRVEGPAALVHNDYSAPSAARRLSMLAQPPTFLKSALQARLGGKPLLDASLAAEALAGKRRFAFVNVWRPISKIESKPLGCVDAATVSGDELIDFAVHHADRPAAGGIYFASHRPAHRWWFFPWMTASECLLVKQWDSFGGLAGGRSDAETGRATFALHSAFADPSSPSDAKDRESIEVRLVVLY